MRVKGKETFGSFALPDRGSIHCNKATTKSSSNRDYICHSWYGIYIWNEIYWDRDQCQGSVWSSPRSKIVKETANRYCSFRFMFLVKLNKSKMVTISHWRSLRDNQWITYCSLLPEKAFIVQGIWHDLVDINATWWNCIILVNSWGGVNGLHSFHFLNFCSISEAYFTILG